MQTSSNNSFAMPIIIQKNAGGDSFPSGLKTGQNSISRAAAT
jgi:hypothetical protein